MGISKDDIVSIQNVDNKLGGMKIEDVVVNDDSQNLIVMIKPFYLDLPEGQKFVKNPLIKEFWDAYESQSNT